MKKSPLNAGNIKGDKEDYFLLLDNADAASVLEVLLLEDLERVLEATFATLAVVRTAFFAIVSPPSDWRRRRRSRQNGDGV